MSLRISVRHCVCQLGFVGWAPPQSTCFYFDPYVVQVDKGASHEFAQECKHFEDEKANSKISEKKSQ